MIDSFERRPPQRKAFREPAKMFDTRALRLFYTVCILCATSVVVAISVKVIMSLFL